MSFTDNTTGRYEWETPPEFFESVNSEFNFTCDVCATPDKTKVPENFYTPEQNGLLQKWNGVCWMNPPYGRDISKWVAKAKRERENGTTTVCLLPSRTDNAWWHQHVMEADEIRFLRGRLKFVGARDSAKFASCLVIFRGIKSCEPVLSPRPS